METRRFDYVSTTSRLRLVAVSLPCLTDKRAVAVGGSRTEGPEQRTKNKEQRTENREQRTENRETARECRLYGWRLAVGVGGGGWRFENRETRDEKRETRTEGPEQRTKNREPRDERRQGNAVSTGGGWRFLGDGG